MPAAASAAIHRVPVRLTRTALATHISAYNPQTQAALANGGGDVQQFAAGINGAITQQGVQISFNNIFYLMGWIILGLIAVIWLARPPFVPKAGPAASGGH